MKLIGTQNDQLLLHFGRREKDLFLHILSLYPRIPPAHQKLSKSAKLSPGSQQLLEEALAEQRAVSQKQVAGLLGQSARWIEHHSGWRLKLSAAEAEWLMQVLNDIRVGSWVRLGCPEGEDRVLDEQTAPHLWAMEIAGSFEMALLEVLEGRQ